jgi:hypothetical protein
LAIAGIALAVHDLKFQLDGDVSHNTTTSVGSRTQTLDWDSFFNSASSTSGTPIAGTLTNGFTAGAFSKDFQTTTKRGATVFSTLDPTTFTTGSKDTLDINPGWQCASSNNVLSKNDIMNAYALAYTETATDPDPGHQILYFGLDRNSNNGDENVAFWFLQSDVSCDSSNGTATFSGPPVDADLLVVSAFTNGGGVSGIDVYRWNGGANGSLGTQSVGHGVDCISGGGTAGGDSICATTNGGDASTGGFNHSIQTPWQTANTSDGLGTTLQPSEFFEGGVDLTSENLGGHCFNTFVGDTRSSQSLTATIFDYALGQLGECHSTTTTTPVDATDTTLAPATMIAGDPANAAVTVKDKATLNVTGVNAFTGTISFHICGPTDASSSATCDSGGVDLGSVNATANGDYFSSTATVTAAGRYCFRAEFSGDSSVGVPGSSDHSATECFTVAPRQATLTTQATTGPVAFGGKISDTVNLANTAHEPGTGGPAGDSGSINPTSLGGDATGNITVVAYGPNSCTTVAFTSGAIAASGNGSYGGAASAFEFTPSAPGQYVFVAAYAGDLPNTLGIPATACSAAPSSEKVTVEQIPTNIKTRQSWIPNDTATVSAASGNLAAGGSVAFSLYDNATCSGTALFSQSRPIAGGNPTEEVSTTNTTTFNITTGYTDAAGSVKGVYSWKVVYTPAAADTAHTGKQSTCNAEHFSITYTNDPGPGVALP